LQNGYLPEIRYLNFLGLKPQSGQVSERQGVWQTSEEPRKRK
jgi:hypothetical protein